MTNRSRRRGLLGRINKQRYVNGRDPAAAKTSILAAIEAYRSVFDEDNKHTWHGVNAASLILRAARDGITGPPPDEARQDRRGHAQGSHRSAGSDCA